MIGNLLTTPVRFVSRSTRALVCQALCFEFRSASTTFCCCCLLLAACCLLLLLQWRYAAALRLCELPAGFSAVSLCDDSVCTAHALSVRLP